ncbi:MAG: hypothetical protein ACFFA0_05145 [Promethearchaeota archaeon]
MLLERKDKKEQTEKQKRGKLFNNNSIKKIQIPLLSRNRKKKITAKSLASIEKLTEIEKDVLNIAEEIFKLKKYDAKFSIKNKSDIEKFPIIGELFSRSFSKLHYSKGYSKDEIFLAIRTLENECWIVPEGRRTKLEILNDSNYKNVIEFIRNNPGVHALDNKIEEELGLTRTPFIKRVITLLRYKIIRTHKIGKIVHFFIEDIPSDHDELKALFLNPLIPRLIQEISKNIYISGIQLGNVLNEPVHKIHYYIKKIKELNIIKKIKDTTGRECYWINCDLLSGFNKVFKKPDFISLIRDVCI